jgi:Glycosyl transferases group 1
VEVVPNGLDLERFTPDGPRRSLSQAAGCVFLFVGGTTWRKGADVLLDAWRRAFGPDDDVLLVIKDFGTQSHYRGQTANEGIAAVQADPSVAPIEYISEDVPFAEIPALYRAADVVVLPYRGEGFCLPALEAMASGRPVIHNGNGPTSEFVGDDCGWALPSERVGIPEGTNLPELAFDGYVHEVDPQVLAEQLRAVASGSADARAEKGSRARARALDYSWDRVAEIASRSLRTLNDENLPLARHTSGATVEAREHFAVYAPDWSRKELWAPAIAAWAEAFEADDPVTLVLHLPDGDAEALAADIMESLASLGRGTEALPDMALCTPSSVGLPSLVRSAAAVLLDSQQAAERPAQLVRRARRAVEADAAALASLRAQLVAGVPANA